MKKHLALSLLTIIAVSLLDAREATAKKFVTSSNASASSPLGPNALRTDSGIQYKDIKIGEGKTPTKGRTVRIHFTSWLFPSGEKVDSTLDRKTPYQFVVGYGMHNQGLDEALLTMKEGGKRLLIIPPELAFGKKGAGNKIPPNATLKYEVELLHVLAPNER
ncbi:MAG: FKBP-type peptidyl-prolyl cis-trans isomerase [Candidatus Obscuribacterales bacterium]